MESRIDRAHAAMEASGDDDATRLRFFERLADAELFLLLAADATDDSLTPEIFALEDGDVALAFDREERLTDFTGRAAAVATLSGRTLVAMLAERGVGLGLNLGAPSETVLPTAVLAWLAETLSRRPDEVEARIEDVRAPAGLPGRVIEALSVKLTAAEGMARHAYLAGVTYADGRRSHLLAFVGAPLGAQRALAGAVSEALTFSGIEAGQIDVVFPDGTHPITAQLARVGLRFDIPEALPRLVRPAPGSDPDTPPRLR
jgi:hypothetical protein